MLTSDNFALICPLVNIFCNLPFIYFVFLPQSVLEVSSRSTNCFLTDYHIHVDLGTELGKVFISTFFVDPFPDAEPTRQCEIVLKPMLSKDLSLLQTNAQRVVRPRLKSKCFLPVLNVHTGRWCEKPSVITSGLASHYFSPTTLSLSFQRQELHKRGDNAAQFQTVSPQRHSCCFTQLLIQKVTIVV